MEDKGTSINKFISSSGYCSRRKADQLLDEGRVTLNGEIAKRGNRVFDGDEVKVDKKVLQHRAGHIYIMLHKPPGVTCTTDKRDPSNIIDYINYNSRIFPVGRLDKPSTGLILLTDDGDIVNKILRVEHQHEKEYVVRVDRPVTESFLNGMRRPVPILGTKTLPCDCRKLGKTSFKIILKQGMNRQIRRMCEYFDYRVVSLKRIRIMHMHLGQLEVGKWRHLTFDEQKTLLALKA